MVKIDFSMIDDCVVPVDDIKSTVRTDLNINGSIGLAARVNECFNFFSCKAATVIGEFVANGQVSTEIILYDAPCPFFWEMAS